MGAEEGGQTHSYADNYDSPPRPSVHSADALEQLAIQQQAAELDAPQHDPKEQGGAEITTRHKSTICLEPRVGLDLSSLYIRQTLRDGCERNVQ